jgi:lysophospholipase L1-like esterase
MLHHALPADKIVVQSILPVTMWVPRELIEHLNDNLKKMAGDFSMHYLDLYPLFLTPKGVADASCLQEDGIHLTQEGYRRWSDAIERFLMNKHE